MSKDQLRAALLEAGMEPKQAKLRAKQIWHWIYNRGATEFAQMTDIATSLAGGQNPLLVLLQQGGQIKDSFGGIGPAMRALASAITPAAVAIGSIATAVGVLGFAFASGEAQTTAFNRAIQLTGNQAGMTAGQFEQLVEKISKTGDMSKGMARDIAQAELVWVENLGHKPDWIAPDLVLGCGLVYAAVFAAMRKAARR